jgi:hypothetical protein
MKAILWDHAVVEVGCKQFKLGGEQVPIVERVLHCHRDMASGREPGEIIGNHHETPVAPALQTRQFHAGLSFLQVSCDIVSAILTGCK